jgi:hypothetical protein
LRENVRGRIPQQPPMIPTPWSSHKKKTMEKILSKSDEPFSSSLFTSLQRWYLWLNVERVTGIEPAWSAWKAIYV